MRPLAILKNSFLTLLLIFAASGAVNANLASGPQNLGPDLHQAASWLEPAPRLGWSGSSYDAASESSVVTRGLKVDPKTVLSGGRSGSKVKNLVGPPNSAVRGGGQRAFVTNDKGEVILDITKDRVKPVTPGQGFGPKRAPTQEDLDILQKVLEGGS